MKVYRKRELKQTFLEKMKGKSLKTFKVANFHCSQILSYIFNPLSLSDQGEKEKRKPYQRLPVISYFN